MLINVSSLTFEQRIALGRSSGTVEMTLTEAGKFQELVSDVGFLLAGLELTDEEGEALIEQVRIRMRRPPEGAGK